MDTILDEIKYTYKNHNYRSLCRPICYKSYFIKVTIFAKTALNIGFCVQNIMFLKIFCLQIPFWWWWQFGCWIS